MDGDGSSEQFPPVVPHPRFKTFKDALKIEQKAIHFGSLSVDPFPKPCALYRVTHQVGSNLPLTSKQKFRFGLACPDLARPKRNISFDVNGRFEPT